MTPTPKKDLVHVLSQKLGLTQHGTAPSQGAKLKHPRGEPMPGSHAALLRRLAGGKEKTDASDAC